MNSSNLDQPYY